MIASLLHDPGADRSVDLAYKLDAEHFAAAPDDFASLADKRMRYGRKSKPASDRDADLSDELRAVQRHIQDLTLVANESSSNVSHAVCCRALRGSRFCFVMSIKTPYPGRVKSFPDKSVKTRTERQRNIYHFHSA
jgi:hypothetical protein